MNHEAVDLAAYLGARVDEEEATARAADGGPWYLEQILSNELDNQADVGCDSSGGVAERLQRWNADHIVAWHPDRVLADIAAKRAILDLLATYGGAQEDLPANPLRDAYTAFFHRKAHATMLALVQPYAYRSDFPTEWKIDA